MMTARKARFITTLYLENGMFLFFIDDENSAFAADASAAAFGRCLQFVCVSG